MKDWRDNLLAALDNARKAAKLIKASIAEMVALTPSPQMLARIAGPVFVLGDGVAAFAAARELARNGVDFFLSAKTMDPESVLRSVHRAYPGERQYYPRLEKIVKEALDSPRAALLPGTISLIIRLPSLSRATSVYASSLRTVARA